MRMRTDIPMMGQPVNALANFSRGVQTAAVANAIGDNNRLRDVFSAQGPAILEGNPDALAQLAQAGPAGAEQAMGVQQHRQTMQINEQNMQIARQNARVRAMELANTLSEQERARVAERLRIELPRAAYHVANGDLEGYNQIARQYPQIPEAANVEQARLQLAGFEEIANVFEEAGLARAGGGEMTVAEQSIARMESIGIPREIAIRIEDGVYKTVTDPITRETVVIDLATGRSVYTVDPANTAQGDASRSSSAVTEAPAQQTPQARPNAATTPELSFSREDTNAQNAFGLRGAAANVANTVSDFFTGQEVAPQVAENQRFFRTYEEDALVFLAQAYPRQPAQALMERIRALVPNVGTVEGASRALGELRALRDRFASDLASAEAQLRTRLSPSDRAQANSRASALGEMLSRTDAAIARFGGGGGANRTSSGVTWEIVE